MTSRSGATLLYKDSSPWCSSVYSFRQQKRGFFVLKETEKGLYNYDHGSGSLPAVRKMSSPSSAGFFEPETGAY
jgi:hypothetical protein